MVGMVLKVKARYEDAVLKPLGKLDLKEGEEVELVIAGSIAKAFRGALKLGDSMLIEELAESDDLF